MEAQQCVKLSLTNRPFGLISHSRAQRSIPATQKPKINPRSDCNTHQNTRIQKPCTDHFRQSLRPQSVKTLVLRFDDPVVMAKAPTPDPIPNSVVKSFSANGTAS